MIEARAVVEVGTGAGVSGLWLLRGMRSDGVLTTIDIEAEHQRLARESFNDAGIPPQRARTIAGAALDVLPRLTDGHYDLVFCDGDKAEYAAYLKEALRLLRPGGIVAFDNALWHDRVADPSQRDEETIGHPRPRQGDRRATSRWCRCCCRSATACWSPRRSGRARTSRVRTSRPDGGAVGARPQRASELARQAGLTGSARPTVELARKAV